ncbi:hypothetical protein WR25_05697 [Diploscapter pachys]|uniref:Uncharacterized protein n=1 Tax=Diploscapter pachys TaxID=2018661 RepID=A0A2A2LIA3_9BILA|nr:hypothetical protein WR25_05697 [Diploscapter pachys]
MSSFIKMFKGHRKGANKENNPQSANFTFTEPYTGERSASQSSRQNFDFKSPYSVVTQPKTNKGPQSWAGVPMRDSSERRSVAMGNRKQANNEDRRGNQANHPNHGNQSFAQSQYENLAAIRNANGNGQSYRSDHSHSNYSRQQKGVVHHSNLDFSEYDSEEEDYMREQRIRELESKVQHLRKKYGEERRRLTDRINYLEAQYERYKQSNERTKQAYSQMKKKYEDEKNAREQLQKMLNDALEQLANSKNSHMPSSNSSLLLCRYGSSSTGGTMNSDSRRMSFENFGAGEALCSTQSDEPSSLPMMQMQFPYGIGPTTTTLHHQGMPSYFTSRPPAVSVQFLPQQQQILSMHNSVNRAKGGVDEMGEMQDEIRIFRKQDSEGSLMENARADSSDTSVIEHRPAHQRSFSDSNIDKLSRLSLRGGIEHLGDCQEEDRNVEVGSVMVLHKEDTVAPENKKKLAHSPTRRTSPPLNFEEGLEQPVPYPQMSSDSEDSDSQTIALYERQLKKLGDKVKYQPPRATVHPRYYKRYGRKEQSAMAEFDYLHDMSTDASGMLSSPEPNQVRFRK